jgi:hypothetical protein
MVYPSSVLNTQGKGGGGGCLLPSAPSALAIPSLSHFSLEDENQTFCDAGKAGKGGGGTQDKDPALRVYPQVMKAAYEVNTHNRKGLCSLRKRQSSTVIRNSNRKFMSLKRTPFGGLRLTVRNIIMARFYLCENPRMRCK